MASKDALLATAAAGITEKAKAKKATPKTKNKAAANGTPEPGEDYKMIAGNFPAYYHRSLKIAALDRGITVQAALGEALDMWFKKAGVKIAAVTE